MYFRKVEEFFSLVKAGLWEDSGAQLDLSFNGQVEWDKVYQIAEEQSVFGLVLAGIEQSNIKPSRELLLQWIGEVQMLEQQNLVMNSFIAELVEKMREVGIYTLLLRGQGIAQCYEKPLWRCSGDVDLLLSYENTRKQRLF